MWGTTNDTARVRDRQDEQDEMEHVVSRNEFDRRECKYPPSLPTLPLSCTFLFFFSNDVDSLFMGRCDLCSNVS